MTRLYEKKVERTWSQMHIYPSEEPLLATHTPCSPQSASEFSVLHIDVFCVQWRPNHPGKQSHLISESILGINIPHNISEKSYYKSHLRSSLELKKIEIYNRTLDWNLKLLELLFLQNILQNIL